MAKKTKLTQGLRVRLAQSIIEDTPKIDYETQIQDYVNQAARAQLPLHLQAKEDEIYLKRGYVDKLEVFVSNTGYQPTVEEIAYVAGLRSLRDAQVEARQSARRNVLAFLDSLTYVEDIEVQAPEFVKYLPVKEAPLANLPAVQLKEQLAALGWPKSDEGT
jgi:hypothetical protein